MPFYGSQRMTAELPKAGHQVNHKRVRRLMRLMGLETLGPKPKTSRPSAQHRTYPTCCVPGDRSPESRVGCRHYLHPNGRGVLYLIVVMD
jgi:putative transposase